MAIETPSRRLGNFVAIAAIVGSLAICDTAALAQQKTARECTAEWRANKAQNQAQGITERAYVAQCRSGTTVAQPTAAPATATTTGQQKTARECTAEWRANKAQNQAQGITERSYVAQCRSGTAAAQPTAAPPAAPRTAAVPRRGETTGTAPSGANQFANEALAKARCPSESVVWVNGKTNIYHFSGHRAYGNTKAGTYMCERDAMAAGARAAKNEKHP